MLQEPLDRWSDEWHEWEQEFNAECESRGIDWDLRAAFQHNAQTDLRIHDIKGVIAVYEGEREEQDWYWFAALEDGRFAALAGGCDYTGWDCSSHLESKVGPYELALAWMSKFIYDANERYVSRDVIWGSILRQVHTRRDPTAREVVGASLNQSGDKLILPDRDIDAFESRENAA